MYCLILYLFILLLPSFYHPLGHLLTTLSLHAQIHVTRLGKIKKTWSIKQNFSGRPVCSSEACEDPLAFFYRIFCCINFDSVYIGYLWIKLYFCVYRIYFLYWGLPRIHVGYSSRIYASPTLIVSMLWCTLGRGAWQSWCFGNNFNQDSIPL